VTAPVGGPLAGVSVRITRPADGFLRELATRADGTFAAALLPPGTYDVTFARAGSESSVVRGVALHAGGRLAVDAVLGESAGDRRWTSGESAIAPTPALQYVVTRPQLQALPLLNRHLAALVATTPGVTSALADEPSLLLPPGDGLAFAGRRLGTAWFLDGAPPLVDDVAFLPLTPSLEALEEVRVAAASPSATWPRGGAVSLVTRSGTNTRRASAYELHRDGALDANSYFRNLSLDPAVRAEPPDVRSDIFGYSAGGPIRRDALFVFWSQEWRRRRGEEAADGLDGRQETARVDHRAGPRWQLMARYTHDVLERAGAPRMAASLGAVRATTALSATAVNEVSYRMASRAESTTHGLADTVAFQRGGHALALGGHVAHSPARNASEAFAQDAWRAHRTLTVDLGLRRAHGGWEPGAGFDWRPRARSETVIRAGFGRARQSTPMRHWNVGVTRRLYAHGAFDAAWLGTRADAHARERERRYDGLLAHFRHDGPAGFLDVAYTLGRERFLGDVAWERASGDRRHVFTATYARIFGGWTIPSPTCRPTATTSAPRPSRRPRSARRRRLHRPFRSRAGTSGTSPSRARGPSAPGRGSACGPKSSTCSTTRSSPPSIPPARPPPTRRPARWRTRPSANTPPPARRASCSWESAWTGTEPLRTCRSSLAPACTASSA
jgi:hypothetical protein